MAVKVNWKVLSDKEAKQKAKPKATTTKVNKIIWKEVWWISPIKMHLHEWVIIKEEPEHYIIRGVNKNKLWDNTEKEFKILKHMIKFNK